MIPFIDLKRTHDSVPFCLGKPVSVLIYGRFHGLGTLVSLQGLRVIGYAGTMGSLFSPRVEDKFGEPTHTSLNFLIWSFYFLLFISVIGFYSYHSLNGNGERIGS